MRCNSSSIFHCCMLVLGHLSQHIQRVLQYSYPRLNPPGFSFHPVVESQIFLLIENLLP